MKMSIEWAWIQAKLLYIASGKFCGPSKMVVGPFESARDWYLIITPLEGFCAPID